MIHRARFVSHSHDTTGSSATSVTGLERVGVTALAKVVGALVDDDRSADDRVGAEERDVLVCMSARRQEGDHTQRRTGDVDGSGAGSVGLDVAEVSDVSLRVLGSTVVLLQGVEVGTGGSASVATLSAGVRVPGLG